MNPFLNTPIAKLNTSQKWIKTYHKIFYTDFNYISKSSIRGFDRIIWKSIKYENRLFEKEAYYYTRF